MSLTDQVAAQVQFMAPELITDKADLLHMVCSAAVSALSNRLRDGLEPEDCQADFVTAAGMYAAAALSEMENDGKVEQFTAGDLTMRRGSKGSAANYLRAQAALLMAPYLQTGFTFLGV